jgi:hypothetical protein
VRDANGSQRSRLFRPTRNLQFNEAAVQALQAADRRRGRNLYTVESWRRSGWRWLGYGVAAYFVLLVLTTALRTCLVAVDSLVTANSEPVDAAVQSRASVETANQEPAKRSLAPLRHEQWTRTRAIGRLPMFTNTDRKALIGSIEDGASFWIIDTGKPCSRGGTWKRVFLTANPTVREPAEGLSCTIDCTNNVKTQQGEN